MSGAPKSDSDPPPATPLTSPRWPQTTFHFHDAGTHRGPSDAHLGVMLGRLLAGSSGLQLLALDALSLLEADARALGEGLARSTSLKVLDMHESEMDAAAIAALSESGLAVNSSLEARAMTLLAPICLRNWADSL